MVKATKPKKKTRKAKDVLRKMRSKAKPRGRGARQAQLMRERRAAARDIGKIPAVRAPSRRKKCRLDPAKFAKTYLPESFPLPFSKDHLHYFEKARDSVIKKLMYAIGVFRGFGKTTGAEALIIWAGLYGHLRFIPIICSDKAHATDILDSIIVEMSNNELLAADFPEVCIPLIALEGISQRSSGQVYTAKSGEHERTFINMGEDHLVLPATETSPVGTIVLKAYGLTSSLRGMKHRTPKGEVLRPDWVLLEDPQTDESAKSLSQCDYREELVNGAISGLGGHHVKLGGLCCCTVIKKNDLADRMLDRSKHPEWQGDKFPMMKKEATHHEKQWLGEYAAIRRRDYKDNEGGRQRAVHEATEYYRSKRKKMDLGCQVAWPEAYTEDEISGIQHAYNWLIDKGAKAFAAECQLAPLDEYSGLVPALTAKQILAKVNGLASYVCPIGTSALVAFADIGSRSDVNWGVCALEDGFGGALVDYGVEKVFSDFGGVEAAITTALTKVVEHIMTRSYVREDGESNFRVERMLVDSGWKTKVIYDFCRWCEFKGVFPSKGQGGEKDISIPKRSPARYSGDGWSHALTRKRDTYLTTYNTDHWKSLLAERLRTPIGGIGSLTINGAKNKKAEHKDLAEQLTSERCSPKERPTGDRFDKWKVLPGRPNHKLDMLAGCLVTGAWLGLKPPTSKTKVKRKKAGRRKGGGFTPLAS